MNYMNLITEFVFEKGVYVFLLIVFSLMTIFVILIFWWLNNLFTRNEELPSLKMNESLYVTFIPSFKGSLLGIVPFLLCILLAYENYTSGIFSYDNVTFQTY